MTKKMQKERFDKILELLKEKEYVKYEELEKLLDLSSATVRRDTIKMENLNLINRISGGIEIRTERYDVDYRLRMSKNLKQKKLIAKKASKYISNKELIFLDAGTSVFELIIYLKNRDVTVVTNCIEHINELIKNNVKYILIGGIIKSSTKAAVGTMAIKQLENFYFDKAFLGTNGVDLERGLTTPDIEEAQIKEKAVKNSKKVYVLADSSKFSNVSNIKFANYDEVEIITDKE